MNKTNVIILSVLILLSIIVFINLTSADVNDYTSDMWAFYKFDDGNYTNITDYTNDPVSLTGWKSSLVSGRSGYGVKMSGTGLEESGLSTERNYVFTNQSGFCFGMEVNQEQNTGDGYCLLDIFDGDLSDGIAFCLDKNGASSYYYDYFGQGNYDSNPIDSILMMANNNTYKSNWIFLGGCYNPTTENMTLYGGGKEFRYGLISSINGLLIQDADTIGASNLTTSIIIGGGYTYNWTINGTIDNVIIWNASIGDESMRYVFNSMYWEEVSQSYSQVLSEGQSSNYKISLNYDTSQYSLKADLNYNGTVYPGTVTGTGNYINISKTLIAPSIASAINNSFKWEINLTNSSGTSFYYNSTTSSQIINPIEISICNSTVTTKVLNFTLYKESDRTLILPNSSTTTNFQINFNYWFGGGTQYKNYSYSLLSNTTINNYAFCFRNLTSNFSVNADIDLVYSAVGYKENYYYLRNATLTYISNDIPLYLIDDATGTKFFLTFKQGASIIPDATVTVQKYIIGLGQYITMGILLTDSDGKSTMWQELDKDYRYSVVKNSSLIGVIEKRSICTAAPCSLTILVETESSDPLSAYYDVYGQNIQSTIYYNKTSNLLSYSFIDTTGLANYFRLVVNKVMYNETGEIICNEYAYTTAGTLTCDMTGYSGEFQATTFISRSPEVTDKVFNFITSSEAIDDLGDMGIFLVLAAIITISIAGAVITKGSPSGVALFLGGGILGLKILTLFPFTWTVVVSIELILAFIIWKVKV